MEINGKDKKKIICGWYFFLGKLRDILCVETEV